MAALTAVVRFGSRTPVDDVHFRSASLSRSVGSPVTYRQYRTLNVKAATYIQEQGLLTNISQIVETRMISLLLAPACPPT